MRLRTILMMLAAAIIATNAAADYKSEYKAYRDAIAADDVDAAIEHGEAAWRQAEDEIGAQPTTAILAYNFATIIIVRSPLKAVEAFERALVITRDQPGSLNADDISIRLSDARLIAEPNNKARADELEAMLNQHNADEVDLQMAQTMGWRTLAAYYLREEKFSKAKESADAALGIAPRLDPQDNRLRAES